MTKPAAKRANPVSAAIHKGMELFNARRYAEACVQLHSALALAPDDPALLMCLSRVYLSLRETEKAEALLRKAVSLKAGAEAALLLGELLQDKGRAEEAMPLLRKAAAEKPGTGPADSMARMAAGLTRFRANVKMGLFAEAFQEAEALLAAEGSQECIDSFFVSPDQRELLPTLEALKAFSVRRPENPWPYFFRATLLSNMGRGEEALAETARLKTMPRRYDWMRYKHGELLLTNRRDYPGARREYAAALRSVPGFWKARMALAEIALCRGLPARAAKISAELIAALPERSKPWGFAYRGRVLLWSGRYQEALVSLEIGAGSGVPYALRDRGAALLLTGKPVEAARDLEDALRSGPDLEALIWRGELRRRGGDLDGAIEDLTAAIRLDGANSFWALANRALAAGEKGDRQALWSDFQTIRRDVLDAFEKEAGLAVKSPSDDARAVLEAGLRLARGMRVSNEYLFPVWMSHRRGA